MPRESLSRRSRSPEDDDSEVSEGPSMGTPSSTSSKRRRLNNGTPQASESPEPSNDLANGSHAVQRPISSSGNMGKHQPGSIVRVKLTNFVTYTAAEFLLGPNLNMIIGPNGTGKSTLVCAICLGLGFSPKHLGRAKDPSEFIHHGQKEAEIEIELAAGPKHRKNPVIRTLIQKDKSPAYFVEGKRAKAIDLSKLCRSFSIQIDNLCQFLPQDRVAEFASLTPVGLLEETQRAAAPPQMTEMHQQLKADYKKLKQAKQNQQTDQEALNNLNARQNASRQDVERITERRQLDMKIVALKKYKPYVRYDGLRDQANALKANAKDKERELKRLETEVEPLLQSVRDKEGYVAEIQRYLEQRETALKQSQRVADRHEHSLEDTKTKMTEQFQEQKSARDRIKATIKKIRDEDVKISKLEEKLQDAPEEFDPAAFNETARAKRRDGNAKNTQLSAANDKIRELREQQRELMKQYERKKQYLSQLSTQEGQMMEKLKASSHDSAKAWEWLQANKTRFQDKVYGPPMIECSVKDRKYTGMVESAIPGSIMKAFTVTNDHDFRLIQEELVGKKGLKLSDVTVMSTRQPLVAWKPSVRTEDLARYGLTGWLLDQIDGPEAVLSMLCEQCHFHSIGVTLGQMSQQQYQQLESSPIQRWFDGNDRYVVTRRYGRSATAATALSAPRIWTDNPVDSSQSTRLNQELAELEDNMKQLVPELEGITQQRNGLDQEVQQLKKELKELEQSKMAKQTAWAQYRLIPNNIESAKQKKQDFESDKDQDREAIQAVQAKIDKLAAQRADQAISYARSVDALRSIHDSILEAKIMHIEGQSEVAALEDENQDIQKRLEDATRDWRRFDQEAKQVRLEAKAAYKELEKATAERTQEEVDLHHEWQHQDPPYTIGTLDNEIEVVSQRAELIHATNPNALRDFEARERKIKDLENKLATVRDNVEGIESQINEVRQEWEPELDEVISQIDQAFGRNFEEIGCAGQVSIHKDDDFDQWSIKIEVKFRSGEEFTQLDSHRQSGGERAVSTIFYLLSLQSLARSPFRVVDEINQGMDPRNERMVHKRLIDIACDEHTSQYFLITPKLLQNLPYHEKMTVHCIASGEYMPRDSSALNFRNMAQVALRVRGRVAAAA